MVAVADTSSPSETIGRGQQKARGSGDGGRLMVADRYVALPEGPPVPSAVSEPA